MEKPNGFSLEPLRLLHLAHSRQSDDRMRELNPVMKCFAFFPSCLRLASRGAPPRTPAFPQNKQLQRMNEQLMPIKCPIYVIPLSRRCSSASTRRLVAVVRGLVRAADRDVKILALSFTEDGQLDIELLQMCAGNLLVKFFGEHVDTKRELLGSGPEGNLGKDLIGERAGHDEGRVASGAPEVHKTTFGKQDDMATVGHGITIDLGFDIDDRF